MSHEELAIHLDPRSPYVLDIHELGRQPGAMRRVRRVVPAAEGLGTDVIGVPKGADLELDLRLESVMEGVLVSGTVRGRAAGECVRCLEEVDLAVDAELQELFAYPDRVVDDEDDDDYVRVLVLVDEYHIDLGPVLRDAVVLALPFQPVCRDDCPGLCSECGARLADDPGHGHEAVDPRWAALQDLVPDSADIAPNGGAEQDGAAGTKHQN